MHACTIDAHEVRCGREQLLATSDTHLRNGYALALLALHACLIELRALIAEKWATRLETVSEMAVDFYLSPLRVSRRSSCSKHTEIQEFNALELLCCGTLSLPALMPCADFRFFKVRG